MTTVHVDILIIVTCDEQSGTVVHRFSYMAVPLFVPVFPNGFPAKSTQAKRPRHSYCVQFRKCRVVPRMCSKGNGVGSGKGSETRREIEPVSHKSQQNTARDTVNHEPSLNHGHRSPPPGGNAGDGAGDRNRPDNQEPSGERAVYTAEDKQSLLSRTRSYIFSEWILFAKQLRLLLSQITGAVGTFLKTVPPQVTVALLGIITALVRSIRRDESERRKSEEKKQAELNKKIAAKVTEVRANYESLETCLLKASYLLANRLIEVAEGSSAGPILDDGKADVGKGDSITYSTYLLARYFASVELLKKNTGVLDLGFPAADRIFSNIIGRIQGVFGADDETLLLLQSSERIFKPRKGRRARDGGELRVLPRAQVSVGELLLRSYWDKDASSSSMNSILTYVEFCELLETNAAVRRWCLPIQDSFRALEKTRMSRKSVGSRVYIAQAALLDLVDFLDPGPRCRFVPLDARRRLTLGESSFDEETRPPASVQAIYRALGALRDGVGAKAVAEMRAKMQAAPLEVYVKAPEGEQPSCMEQAENGDCPHSQSVLLLLEELAIPYRAVRIRNDDKPAWFHLINPHVRTPVVYHEGHLVSDSRAIMAYIEERFSDARLPGSIHECRRRVGSKRFTRFHGAFLRWIYGEERSQQELDSEIRRLDAVLRDVARRNEDGGPFFGDTRFSREDIAISPFLYHTVVAGKKLKKWSVPADCDAVKRYIDEMNQVQSFVKTKASTCSIVDGYSRLMRDGEDRQLKLAIALE